MKNRAFGSVLFILSALVIVVPRYILPVCEFVLPGHEHAVCSFMYKAEAAVGVVAMALSAAMFFSKTADALRWLAFAAFFAGGTVIAAPGFVGYCQSPRMPCHYGAVPGLKLVGGLIALVSAAGFLAAGRKKA